MTDPVVWGILGTATIARKCVIPAIQKSRNGQVLALATRTPAAAEEVVATNRIEHVYDTYNALLTNPDIDAVYIPLPNHMHHPCWQTCAVRKAAGLQRRRSKRNGSGSRKKASGFDGSLHVSLPPAKPSNPKNGDRRFDRHTPLDARGFLLFDVGGYFKDQRQCAPETGVRWRSTARCGLLLRQHSAMDVRPGAARGSSSGGLP